MFNKLEIPRREDTWESHSIFLNETQISEFLSSPTNQTTNNSWWDRLIYLLNSPVIVSPRSLSTDLDGQLMVNNILHQVDLATRKIISQQLQILRKSFSRELLKTLGPLISVFRQSFLNNLRREQIFDCNEIGVEVEQHSHVFSDSCSQFISQFVATWQGSS
eukprot:TRINITY_DN3296_c0_g2_i2.p1 TRINITY_DN3296_c0_g2~~TRINITY_DN3296_c0_g2_i2.p1  ORF type:complete len:162 (-),score=32.18 TRINITY_DN3296_c0_g2_i2:132-617(-)